MLAPGIAQLMKDFHTTNDQIGSLAVTIYLLGFACGPLAIAPLSELYGRLPFYHVCNLLWIIFSVACAVATNMPSFIVFRFIAGCAGSCPLTIGGGTVVDVIPQRSRGIYPYPDYGFFDSPPSQQLDPNQILEDPLALPNADIIENMIYEPANLDWVRSQSYTFVFLFIILVFILCLITYH
jgi:hypothetical protein